MLGKLLWLAGIVASTGLAAEVQLPGGSVSVAGTTAGGFSFSYPGTLTESDTIAFTLVGNPCLQAGGFYCTNGAGVVTTAGTTPVGGSSSFTGPTGIIPAGTWTYGSLLMSISGVGTVQVFPTDAAHGVGSAAPPAGLNLSTTTLAALGFGTFSQANPTITFVVADGNFGDNKNRFILSQSTSADVSDLWWNPAESGWGLQLVRTGNFVFATVYVYASDGKPTWVFGELYRSGDAPVAYTGPSYVSTGTYYGSPYIPGAFGFGQVGTMTFVSTGATTGLLVYSVDGLVVHKSVERQPLLLDDYNGTYGATHVGTAANCANPAGNVDFAALAVLQFSQNGPAMSTSWLTTGGDLCIHTGTYSQMGRLGTLIADYTCQSGEAGTSTFSEMTTRIGTFSARLWTYSAASGCTTTGRVSGVGK